MRANFYCQKVTGDASFSIDDWNKTYDEIKDLGLSEKEETEILFGNGEPCKEQCFDCMAIVGQRQAKTKSLTPKPPSP